MVLEERPSEVNSCCRPYKYYLIVSRGATKHCSAGNKFKTTVIEATLLNVKSCFIVLSILQHTRFTVVT